MRRFWQRWSYWDFEDKLVWVGKRLLTLFVMGAIVLFVITVVTAIKVAMHLFTGVHWESVLEIGVFTALMSVNYYMLDGCLWD